jgi:8-oxo-dGTP diphosphatase
MARTPIMGAGGIVVRDGPRPLIALVQRRKDDAWVLPKGKLKRKEEPVAAAEREVVEETGYEVEIHEYLGAISYKAGGKPKLVEFWYMQAVSKIGRKPARDIKAVQWLPLDAAIARLELPLEQLFLRNVGPRALAKAPQAAAAPIAMPHAMSPAMSPAKPDAPVVPDAPTVVLAPQPRRGFLQLILDAFTLHRRSRA